MTSKVRFVHAADFHLGAGFKRVDAADTRVRDALVAAAFESVRRVIDLCIKESVDFLVVAGDLFDAEDRGLRAESFLIRQFGKLAEAGIPVFVALGNHDPADGRSGKIVWPSGVTVFEAGTASRHEVPCSSGTTCAVYGVSFPERKVTRNLVREFVREKGDAFAVGVVHTNVGSRPGWDDYAPCEVADLAAGRMDYWALGHIHLHSRVSDEPRVVYAGSPQGLDPNERGEHGCYLVGLDKSGPDERFVSTSSVVWESVEVDVSTTQDLAQVDAAVRDAVRGSGESDSGRPTITRVILTGRTKAHDALVGTGGIQELVEALRDETMSWEPWTWVDSVKDHTRSAIDVDVISDQEGLAGELVRCAGGLIESGDPRVAEEIEGIVGRLPSGVEPDLDVSQIWLAARDVCLDMLLGEGE